MSKKLPPRPADFERLGIEDQEKIRAVRQRIIDTALGNIPSVRSFEPGNPGYSAGRLITKLSRDFEVTDTVEMLRLTGMSDEDIIRAGIVLEQPSES